MTRRQACAFALAVLASGCAATGDADLSTEVNALMQTQQNAWNRGDLQAFMVGYVPDERLAFVGKDGVVRGYAGLLERYRRIYPDREAMGQLHFSEIDVWTLDTDHALATGRYELTRQNDQPRGIFSLVFVRRDGRLLIHMDHTTAIEESDPGG